MSSEFTPQRAVCNSGDDEGDCDPDPDDERKVGGIPTSEARRRTAAEMDGIESVDEMMARRALPPAEGE
jgi:hypothetical protein